MNWQLALLGALVFGLILLGLRGQSSDDRYSNFPDSSFWRYWYYGNAGQVPPNIYTRFRYHDPGFYTTGYHRWALRPGIRQFYPRYRWTRHNNRYYYLNNGGHELSRDMQGGNQL